MLMMQLAYRIAQIPVKVRGAPAAAPSSAIIPAFLPYPTRFPCSFADL
jgi:hypothetical protein